MARLLAALGLLAGLLGVGCGDLAVPLNDGDKDGLADFVERDGQAPDAGTPDDTPDGGGDDAGSPDAGDSDAGAVPDVDGLERLDHLMLDALLLAHVRDGRVDYPALARPESRQLLDAYLALIAALDPAQLADPDERLAFWLNAYNALVLRVAAEGFAANPAFSPADGDFAMFKARVHTVGGQLMSLDQLEHGVLRGDMAHGSLSGLPPDEVALTQARHEGVFGDGPVDPRIHVGLNCAATSCPALPSAAFRADTLDAALRTRAQRFVADPTRGAGPEGISSIFDWFSVDFEASAFGSARGFIEAHRVDADEVAFDRFLPYDWRLNCDCE